MRGREKAMGLEGRMCWKKASGILLNWLDRVSLHNWTSRAYIVNRQ